MTSPSHFMLERQILLRIHSNVVHSHKQPTTEREARRLLNLFFLLPSRAQFSIFLKHTSNANRRHNLAVEKPMFNQSTPTILKCHLPLCSIPSMISRPPQLVSVVDIAMPFRKHVRRPEFCVSHDKGQCHKQHQISTTRSGILRATRLTPDCPACAKALIEANTKGKNAGK
jgi:hypothetical protein